MTETIAQQLRAAFADEKQALVEMTFGDMMVIGVVLIDYAKMDAIDDAQAEMLFEIGGWLIDCALEQHEGLRWPLLVLLQGAMRERTERN